jgi:hypothetical protein
MSAELLSCVRHTWPLSWDPDNWGVDMNMEHAQASIGGHHDLWHHRILYVCAKVLILRTSLRQSQGLGDDVTRVTELNSRFQEWALYNNWCEQWEQSIPRSLVPLGYLQPWQTMSKSVFPEIWYVEIVLLLEFSTDIPGFLIDLQLLPG